MTARNLPLAVRGISSRGLTHRQVRLEDWVEPPDLTAVTRVKDIIRASFDAQEPG
jgi:hypothetical protein